MNLRQPGVTITIQRSLNKEAALKSLRDASAQLKKVSELQAALLLGVAETGMQAFSMLSLSHLNSAQVQNFADSTKNRDTKQGKELEEASKLAGEMRLLAERAAILLAEYVASNSDANENANINKVIAEYKAVVAEVLSIGNDKDKEEIAEAKHKADSSAASSSKLDPHQALYQAAETVCAQKAETFPFMKALNDKKYGLALRIASASGSLPLVHLLAKNLRVLSINVNEPSSNGRTALDWIENAKDVNKNIKEAITKILLFHQAKSGIKAKSAESTSYGVGSSAMYTASAVPINTAATQDKATQEKIFTPQ